MKKSIVFLFGALIGLILCFALFYTSGIIFENLGIRLYESESEQQRNFNIFLGASLIFALVAGILFAKKTA